MLTFFSFIASQMKCHANLIEARKCYLTFVILTIEMSFQWSIKQMLDIFSKLKLVYTEQKTFLS